MKDTKKRTEDARESATDLIAKMLEDGLKTSFNELIRATKRFDETPHIATGAAKARAISEFHDRLAEVSQKIYRTWQLEWSDEIPSEEMSEIIHKAAGKVGFDDTKFIFTEEI